MLQSPSGNGKSIINNGIVEERSWVFDSIVTILAEIVSQFFTIGSKSIYQLSSEVNARDFFVAHKIGFMRTEFQCAPHGEEPY